MRFTSRSRSYRAVYWLKAEVKLTLVIGLLLAMATGPKLVAGVIAVDGFVPTSMSASGAYLNPAEYVIGGSGAYNRTWTPTIHVGSVGGGFTDLIIQNGSVLTARNLTYLNADRATLRVTGAGSEFNSTSGVFFIGRKTEIEVLDGGSASVTAIYPDDGSGDIIVDGTNSELEVRGTFDAFSAADPMDILVRNGGSLVINSFTKHSSAVYLVLTNQSRLEMKHGQDFSAFTLFSFAASTLVLGGPSSNLGAITSGQVVDLRSGGSFSTSTVLNGGLLLAAELDASNLVFSSGTLTVTGALTNFSNLGSGQNLSLDGGSLNEAGSASAISLSSDAVISGHGEIYGDLSLGSQGTVNGETAGEGIAIYGNVNGSGTLSNVTLDGNLDVGNSPGSINLEGVTLAAGSEVKMEIYGTGVGEYDTLTGDAMTDVSGAELTIAFVGYTPTSGDSWQMFLGSIDPTIFNTVIMPNGMTLDSSGLVAIPEPRLIGLLLGMGCLMLSLRRRR